MQFIVMQVSPESGGASLGGGENEMSMNSRDYIKSYHLAESSAEGEAKKKATANPGKQYAVMTIKKIFETAKPVFIEKTVNEAGEIVVVPK